MPAPVITELPEAPSIADPANFATEASAFVAAQQTFRNEVNAFGVFLNVSGIGGLVVSTTPSTYGGTADAIELTTGASLTSLTTGLQLRFTATATNTGATTIDTDSIGAVSCVTVAGATLPAGYIRTDVETVAVYDGTDWVVDRQPELGTNANGEYVRLANGLQLCWENLTNSRAINLGLVGGYRSGSIPWTYPAQFSVRPCVTGESENLTAFGVHFATPTTSSVGAYLTAVSSQGGTDPREYAMVATGQWY